MFCFLCFPSDGLHPSPCSVSLWQHQDGEVPAAGTSQRQQQNLGEGAHSGQVQNYTSTALDTAFTKNTMLSRHVNKFTSLH